MNQLDQIPFVVLLTGRETRFCVTVSSVST